MSDNWLDEYKEGLFSGKIPMENPKIRKPGDPKYYYFDPRGMDKHAPLKDWKLIGVPTADTPNPALVEISKKGDSDKELLRDVEHSDEIFNRVFSKTLGEEGGYEYRPDRIDTPTNMGFQQETLNRFKIQHPDLSQGYPENIQDLTYNQGRQIARRDYFDKYRIDEILHRPIQETMFDSFFNHSPKAPALWAQRAINQYTNMKIDEDGIFGSQTLKALNNLSQAEMIKVNNAIIDQRLSDYEKERITNPNPNYSSYTVGLPNRFERFRIK